VTEANRNRESESSDGAPPRQLGGVIHSYQKYDPKEFPSPTAEPDGSLANAAMEYILEFGSLDGLTEEQLANAIRLDPSMFPRLGPSLESMSRMLRERKAKILATYKTEEAQSAARDAFEVTASHIDPPKNAKDAVLRAIRERQIRDLERLWYRQRDESSDFSKQLLRLIQSLGNSYQVDELASKYAFTGRTAMGVEEALEVKHELETIDELLAQIEEAKKSAQLAILDLDSLSEFADADAMEELNQVQRQIEEHVREAARQQGLEKSKEGFRLTPQAARVFQKSVLSVIFSGLKASRSGRHDTPTLGEGPVETQKTRAFEFGDSPASLDLPQSILNAAVRHSTRPDEAFRVGTEDLVVQRTRVNPKCATAVLVDMSGSMRYNGQYVNSKRMALALDGLIRSEYPGDFLAFFEVASVAALVPPAEVAALLPKPVSIHNPVVRLKADLSDPNVLMSRLPQHFTNLQHGMRLARQVLASRDTPNRQILMITDGLPTAHFEGSELYMLYPPDPRTERETMREAAACAREGITINIFLVPSWSQSEEDVAFAHRLAETTRGRVFFTAGKDLDRFVVWDYVSQRRSILA
jgi:uncharacterized protein with von Willebrand factor type A (vWA) domain